MPPTPTPTDPEHPQPEAEQPQPAPDRGSDRGSDGDSGRYPDAAESRPEPVDPDAPLTFIPHAPDGSVPRQPVRIRTGRWGEMEEHELLHLLDSFEDERARARFRESIYIALFIWMAMALLVIYGPRYLWHAPQVISVADAMREHELTVLNAPVLPQHRPPSLPRPALDKNTLERLRAMKPSPPPPPAPAAPTPAPVTPPPPSPVVPTPVTPRTSSPIVPEAPTPQPSTRTNFGNPSSAGDNLERAMEGSAHSRGEGNYGPAGRGGSPLNFGGIEVLSPNPDNVDFGPYLRRLLADIRRNWEPLIPEEARPPLYKRGQTLIRFSILPDGRIGAMALDGSTHDDAINKAAWGAITSEGQFPPLPSKFHGPNLELRINFMLNEEPTE